MFFILPTLLAVGAKRIITFAGKNLNGSKFNVPLMAIGFEKVTKYYVSGLYKLRVHSSTRIVIALLAKYKPEIFIIFVRRSLMKNLVNY